MYIALEWVVGVGKSTQTKLLTERLEKKLWKEVITVREPGGTEIAQAIRTLVQATEFEEEMQPVTDAYLYASARAQLIHGFIKPALEAWKIVLSDRCVVSSLTIQWVAQWYGIQQVWDINKAAVGWCLPDIVIFLDLPVEEWLARTFDSEGDKFERKPTEFSLKIYEWNQQMFEFPPIQDRMVRIDASWSEEEVFERLKKVIRPLL
jgi:dTMP kinase